MNQTALKSPQQTTKNSWLARIRQKKKLWAILLLVVALLLPLVFTNAYHRTIFNRTLINIIVVLGLNFITGLTGQMNLGTAGIFAIGAYLSGLLTTRLGLSPWIGLLAALVGGYLIGKGLGYPSLRVKGVYLSLTTIGFSEIIRLLITNLVGVTGGTQGVRNIPGYSLFGFAINTEMRFYYFLLAFMLCMLLISVWLVYSKWGRAFKAIRDNEEAAEASGINIAELKIKAFTLAAMYGCLAGALYAPLMSYINPISFNQELSISYVIMLMAGGIGSVAGNVIGAIVVTVLPEALRFLKDYYQLVFSVLVLLFAIFRPNGLISYLFPDKNVGSSLITISRKKRGRTHATRS